MDSEKDTVLVVSAHAADFVWRAGGAIALYASRHCRVRVLCLSYGERGESEKLWRQPGMTLEQVKKIRRAECERAAGVLGAEIRFFDVGDYPLRPTHELTDELVQEFRRVQPTVVLTHSLSDPYNGDHGEAARITMNARVYAQAAGYPSEEKKLGAPPVFLFEPHQTEMCEFKPQVLLDITPVFELKRKAMECMEAQEHLWEYYTDVAKRRGTQAVRNSGRKAIKYAEAYQRIYPQVTDQFS
ncbi:MAG TPA: PIG-L deacetylase family protein [Blastocatellia bacterium]|nr:PIG-L deacetylase family protein [Blastocatellia bacterium]